MQDRHRIHIIVSGRVQGVFFRDFTRRKAQLLGLTGWVRNTDDGKVEIVAEGKKDKLEQLIAAVKIGPASAKVTDCKVQWLECRNEFIDFQIVY
ncbi:MAG: acylphosphatase [candidate division WOR-3 bacterium]|nr:acylphosphatase [candidate division WOR-3 bacterium]